MKAYILLLFLSLSSSLAISQQWEWVRQISGTANDTGYAIDVDDEGNVFMVGRCKNLTLFEDETDPIGPISIGDRDAFISKYNKYGQLQWAVQAGAVPFEYDLSESVVADGEGGCYTAGFFNFTSRFGEDSLTSNGGRDAFISHIGADGEFLWTKGFGGPFADYGYGVGMDPSGNVVICGSVYGVVDIEGTEIGTDGKINAYMAKYSGDGEFQEAHYLAGAYKSLARKITFDKEGNIYLCGSLNGNCTYEGTPLATGNSTTWNDAILIKFNPDFTLNWFQSGGGVYYDIANGVAVSDESVYICGIYTQTATFDTITRTFNSDAVGSGPSNAASDLFIASYDKETGDIKWLVDAGSGGRDELHGVSVSENENIYFSGLFKDSIAFGDTTLYSGGLNTNQAINGRLDEFGNLVWVKETGNDYNNRAYGMCLDKHENLYIMGDFYNEVSFDGIIRVPQQRDAFGGKLTQHSDPLPLVSKPEYCFGDTIVIELTGISSPLTYTYEQSDAYIAWTDSNHIYYHTVDMAEMELSGTIYAENNVYLDSVILDLTVPIIAAEDCGSSITELSNERLTLSYNSANGILINQNTEKIEGIVVSSVDGKRILNIGTMTSGESSSLKELTSGIYIVHSIKENNLEPIKIVVGN